jgi:hypothetical protein
MGPPRYSLWEDEAPFCISTDGAARSVFSMLDDRLNPRVFFVGFGLTDSRLPFRCSGVVPTECGYAPDVFASLQPTINSIRVTLPRGTDLLSWLGKTGHARKGPLLRLSSEIQLFLNERPESQGWLSFCSIPVLMGDYLVCSVLQMDLDVYVSHPFLSAFMVDRLSHGGMPSLIAAVAEEFLETCEHELSVENPGNSVRTWRRDAAEIVRGGGRRLMTFPIAAAGRERDPSGVFSSLDIISSQRYEGEVGSGRLVLARRGHENLAATISLREAVNLDDHRAVRKLLQLSSGNLPLLSDTAACYGLGTVSPQYDPEREDLFVVSFVKHHTWQLRHDDDVLMHVANGTPGFLHADFPATKLEAELQRLFAMTPEQAKPLLDLAEDVAREPHGSMLVISANDAAAAEATRLGICNQATAIDPCQLAEDVLQRLTRIDGAVLVDLEGRCHAIGVILDGVATDRGSRARGARYNSALRYIETRDKAAVSVVKSEDGMIEVITRAR